MSAPALEKGLSILDYLYENQIAGFNQMKVELEINAASLNRYLTALLNSGYVEKQKDGKYVLGSKFALLFNAEEEHIKALVYPSLVKIVTETSFTAVYFTFSNGRMTCLVKELAKEGLVMQFENETRIDFLSQPWGHIYLASFSDNIRRQMALKSVDRFEMLNCKTKEELLDLAKENIKDYREKGYADDKGLLYRGIRRIAYPVHNKENVIGAIVIGGITDSFDEARFSKVIEVIGKEAKDIEKMIKINN